MRGVAHYGDTADCVGACGEVVAHGPHDEVGGVGEEGDDVVGFWGPGGEEGGEVGVAGWLDGFFVGPVWEFVVHDGDVEDFAMVDGVAHDGFACEGGGFR